MSVPDDGLKRLAEAARGRCHSCFNSRHYDLPSGSRYWCRAFGVEMNEEQHRQVKGCPRWRPYSPPQVLHSGLADNPLLHELVNAEDLLFWKLQYHLDLRGLDLRTLIVIAHPGTSAGEDLKWTATLDDRFSDQDPQSLAEVLSQLRALGYLSLCLIVEQATRYDLRMDTSDA